MLQEGPKFFPLRKALISECFYINMSVKRANSLYVMECYVNGGCPIYAVFYDWGPVYEYGFSNYYSSRYKYVLKD